MGQLFSISTTTSLLLVAMLVIVSVATLLVVRSNWGKKRPIHRCVLLSLVAHLLIIAIAAMVQLVAWPPGQSASKPVRVSIVAPLPTDENVVTDAPPPVETPDDSPSEEPLPEPAETKTDEPSKPTEPLVAPSLHEEPKPEVTPVAETPTPEPVAAQTPPTPAPTTEKTTPVPTTEPVAAQQKAAPVTPTPATTPTETKQTRQDERQVASAPAPEVPPELAERQRPDRLQTVIEQGGSQETEQAVARALEWLAYAQSKDGRWDADRWRAGREQYVLNHDRGGAGTHADTGISSLALLTFLGAGHTHLDGGYRRTMIDGLNFLLRSQASDGNLHGNASLYAQTYCHSMSTFALAEAYALTGDKRLEPAVRRAVDFLVKNQDSRTGGWRYRPYQSGDVSQLGWIIMALRSAEIAGVEVPDETWQRIEHFLASVTRGQHGGLACYQPQTPTSVSMTAEAMYCRQVLGKPLVGRAQGEALSQVSTQLPGAGRANFYYWYYGTLALHHAQNDTSAARHTWNQWNESLKLQLVNSQVSDGTNNGSWSPNTLWGGYGGRVYSTAMAAMCLEVYYRFHSTSDDGSPWMAGRPRPGQSVK